MKRKRFLSLLLALVMSLTLAAPVFAAEPDDGDEGIMPLTQVYPEEYISISSGNSVGPFTTTPANGKYLRVWFRNNGSESVTVMLMDSSNSTSLKSMSVPAGGRSDYFVYTIPTPNRPCTYYIRFYSPETGARINGYVAAAQYADYPAA